MAPILKKRKWKQKCGVFEIMGVEKCCLLQVVEGGTEHCCWVEMSLESLKIQWEQMGLWGI